MAQKKINKKGISAGKVAAISAGVIAAGAGAYYFLGPKGKAHQKKAKVLINKVEKQIEKKAKPVIKKAEKALKKTVKVTEKIISKKKK